MRKSAKEGILQKCITQEGVKLLLEIHSGSYGNHAASRNLVAKAFRAGFYWPTAMSDAEDLVRHYEGRQFFTKQIHVPAQELKDHPSLLALRMPGTRYDRAFQASARWFPVRLRRHR